MNIKKRMMKNRCTRMKEKPYPALPPLGSYRHHNPARCVCCSKMEDVWKKTKITKTGRKYMVKQHYTCPSTHVL
jgi:hypothetical protein